MGKFAVKALQKVDNESAPRRAVAIFLQKLYENSLFELNRTQ